MSTNVAAANHAPATFDVAIVGAGPAGAAAALALSGRGWHVAIIEKAVPPRYKTCGGGILRRAAHLLPIDFASAVERQCFEVELRHRGPDLRFLVRREHPIISLVMRESFDHLLMVAAQERGTQLIAGTSVLNITPRGDDVELATPAGVFHARFVIAADGTDGAIARTTGLPKLRDAIPALECEVTLEPPLLARFSRAARFDFGLVPFGYAWVFPKREHLSIGVLTTRRGGANLHDCFQNYLRWLGIGKPIHEERHGFMIPVRAREGALGVRRVLFVGDAAGFADPVTAEGITSAILSGQLAARAIAGGNFEETAVKKIYRASLSAELLPELRVARFIARVLYDCPRLRAALLSRHGRSICELVTNVMMGLTTYGAAVRRPANYFKLVRGLVSGLAFST